MRNTSIHNNDLRQEQYYSNAFWILLGLIALGLIALGAYAYSNRAYDETGSNFRYDSTTGNTSATNNNMTGTSNMNVPTANNGNDVRTNETNAMPSNAAPSKDNMENRGAADTAPTNNQ